MSTKHEFKPGEFNYEEAWTEWAKPRFDALPADIRELYESIRDQYPDLNQLKDLSVRWPTLEEEEQAANSDRLKVRFENVAAEWLLKSIPIVYAYGHWGSGWAIKQDGGAYWKYEHLAKQVMLEKNKTLGWDLKWDTPEEVSKKFTVKHPHEIAIDEVLEGSTMKRYDIIHCNHKPHPFTIGPRHLSNSRGMFLEPDAAPCAFRTGRGSPPCSLSHKEHTCDTVLVLQGFDKSEEHQALIKTLAPIVEEHGIDGFAFIAPDSEEGEAASG